MWLLDIVDGLLSGLFTALIPGLHPLLLQFKSDVSAAVAYGLYSTLSIIPSTFLGAFSAVTAYTAVIAHRLVRRGKGARVILLYSAGAVAGVFLALAYYPLAALLQFRLPTIIIFLVLVCVSVLTILRSRRPNVALLLAIFYSLYGFIILKLPIPVSEPLTISISGIFGMSTVLLSIFSNERFRYGRAGKIPAILLLRGAVFGLLAAFIVAYFPAVSVSLAAFLIQPLLTIRDEEMIVASGSVASASLLLTTYGRNFGLVRSSLAADLPKYVYVPRVWSAVTFGVCFGVFLAVILASYFYRLYSTRFVKILSIMAVISLAFAISGIPGVLLSVSSIFAGTLTHIFSVEKRVAMFFLLAPTLLYYAPM